VIAPGARIGVPGPLLDVPAEDRVDKRRGMGVGLRGLGWDADGFGQLAKRDPPTLGRLGKPVGYGVGPTAGEDFVNRAAQPCRVQRRELGDQREVDEILRTRAGPRSLVDAGIGVELLGDVELERRRRHGDRLDPRQR
jgi:hypothetical protein